VARSRFGGVEKADIELGRVKGVGRMVKRYGVLILFPLPFLTCLSFEFFTALM